MRVGFIGVGNIGAPMCLNVIKAGHEVTVFDVVRANADPHLSAGAKWAAPAELAAGSELLFTSLPGPPEVQDVIAGSGGVAAALQPGSTYVDLSTNSVTLVRRLHKMLKEKQVDMLDAPVSGGATGAAAGTLAVWIGGDHAAFQRVEPVLKTFGDKLNYLGDSGAGTIAKVVHNQMSMASMMAQVEGFIMGVKAGIEPEMLLKALSAGVLGQTSKLSSIHLAFKGGVSSPQFKLKLARKDLMLALDMAHEFNVTMPLASQVVEVMTQAMGRGWSDRDVTDIYAYLEEAAGVKARP